MGKPTDVFDVTDIGAILPHTVQHILDVGTVQFQKPRFDHPCWVVVPRNVKYLPAVTNVVHHASHQLVQTITISALVLYGDIILDVLQN